MAERNALPRRCRAGEGWRLVDAPRVSNHRVVEPSDADASHADLVVAFFHPPRVVVCAFESSVDDEITIVSHVELWPWRTIVRGSVTHAGSNADHTMSDGGHLTRSWLQQWSLVDDVGTEYQKAGAGRGGDGFCQDVEVRFSTAVPPEARMLTITAPGGHRIELTLEPPPAS